MKCYIFTNWQYINSGPVLLKIMFARLAWALFLHDNCSWALSLMVRLKSHKNAIKLPYCCSIDKCCVFLYWNKFIFSVICIFLSVWQLCGTLIQCLINRYLDDNATTDAISSRLREICPSLYSTDDATCSKVKSQYFNIRPVSSIGKASDL